MGARGEGNSRRGLKICCGVTIIFFIMILVVLVVLFITIFKLKEPKIVTQPVSLQNLELQVLPVIRLNISLGILITVNNPNYGSFAYQETTSHVKYHGHVVAEAEIEEDTIPAHRKHNISTTAKIFADELISDENFLGDYFNGVLNFTASTTLHGKVHLLKFFKLKATSYSTCNISVFVQSKSIDSNCKSTVSI
ncbi:hypothetical protein FEM48_Zijuj01G0130200 [Ziziphus jujuba var. spinosa]|uniref:Late embryogenesis abundant protein At1g64065-like n=1 Tax=Ziziphus jujuba var. spinosa TaxID=714518 RepID=A0A978W1E7_ZIZJJ|nr:hypothetical protein FEM48_Zijuj01G0130200 [Ziziphus jujuba var. spinosa]